MRYVVLVEETITHRVELEASSAAGAEIDATVAVQEGFIKFLDPHADRTRVVKARVEQDNRTEG